MTPSQSDPRTVPRDRSTVDYLSTVPLHGTQDRTPAGVLSKSEGKRFATRFSCSSVQGPVPCHRPRYPSSRPVPHSIEATRVVSTPVTGPRRSGRVPTYGHRPPTVPDTSLLIKISCRLPLHAYRSRPRWRRLSSTSSRSGPTEVRSTHGKSSDTVTVRDHLCVGASLS